MTATMHDSIVAELAQAAAESLAQIFGVDVIAGVPAAAAVPTDDSVVALRTPLALGEATGDLVTAVPAAGATVGATTIEPGQLVAALVEGVGTAVTRLKGAAVQVGAAEPAPSDFAGASYVFDLTMGSDAVKICWVVEASLGALIADGDPVDPPAAEGPSVAPASFPELTPHAMPGRARELQLLADVPMNVTVEVGRGSLQVRELLALVQGSIVELDRVVGSPVDVMVNGTLIAHGDIVLVGDDLGVRITEIVEPV
jgi:flagellar motor switch protein FliN/FliY